MICAMIASIALTAAAPSEPLTDPEAIARAYLDAYVAIDLETVRSLQSEDFMFADETLVDANGDGAFVYADAEAFLGLMAEYAETHQPISARQDWDRIFESNGRVVFSGQATIYYPTDNPAEWRRWRARAVAIITVIDGRVTRHRDFVDYDGQVFDIVPAGSAH